MNSVYDDIMALQGRLAQTSLRFNAVAPATAVQQFEADQQVELPLEYKLFVQHIGNGGAGPPAYGLQPLGTDENWWYEAQRRAWRGFERIRAPFPFTQQWLWEDEEGENLELQDRIFDGTIYLGTDGCGMDWALVVTGEQRGSVWQLTEVGISPCRPALTFLQWFRKWLDHDPTSPELFWWAA